MIENKPKILILGASGGVGSLVYRHLAATQEYNLVGTYFNHPKPGLIPLDSRNPETVREVFYQTSPDAILDFAGLSNETVCKENPDLAKETNVDGLRNIVKRASSYHIPLFFPGTINEFSGITDGTTCTENTPQRAKTGSVYGETKIAAGEIIANECTAPWTILRTDLVLGPQFGIVGLFEKNQYGQIRIDATRFPVFVDDYVKYIQAFIKKPSNFRGIFHLVSPEFKQGILLSELAPQIVTRFNLAKEYQIISHAVEILPRSSQDMAFPIYIDARAKELATENRIFASTRL